MATKRLLALVAALPLLVNGCGSGDDAEAKQAALAPAHRPASSVAKPAEVKPGAPAPGTRAPADSAVAAAPADSSASDDERLGRESFAYTGGSRDPFLSLLSTAKVGPELPDLILVAIYYDTRNPGLSVAVLREKIGNKKYDLRPGDRLGRMRVGNIQPKDVTFLINDFGTERRETLSLRKQEDIQ